MSINSITFYNISNPDDVLTKDPCAVCLNEVTGTHGKAHSPASSLIWRQRKLQHAIHEGCLGTWIGTQLNNGHPATCPSCRGTIILPLKDRAFAISKLIAKDAYVGAILGVGGAGLLALEVVVLLAVAARVGESLALLVIPPLTLGVAAFGLSKLTSGVEAEPLEILGALTGALAGVVGGATSIASSKGLSGVKMGIAELSTLGLATTLVSAVGVAALGVIRRRYFA